MRIPEGDNLTQLKKTLQTQRIDVTVGVEAELAHLLRQNYRYMEKLLIIKNNHKDSLIMICRPNRITITLCVGLQCIYIEIKRLLPVGPTL